MNVTGTIQQVYDALDKANPNFRQDFGINNTADNSVLAATTESDSSYELQSLVCNVFDYAQRTATTKGVEYLNSVPGSPANGPGPGNCGRVSCSYESAIYWCNDVSDIFGVMKTTLRCLTQLLTLLVALQNPDVMSLDSYGSISWAVQFVLDSDNSDCGKIWGELAEDDGVKGQVFLKGNWNVVVRKDEC